MGRRSIFFNRLPPEVRAMILSKLEEHSSESPVSVSEMVHILGERQMHVDLSEATLKSSIAEAALKKGLNVAFDGT